MGKGEQAKRLRFEGKGLFWRWDRMCAAQEWFCFVGLRLRYPVGFCWIEYGDKLLELRCGLIMHYNL